LTAASASSSPSSSPSSSASSSSAAASSFSADGGAAAPRAQHLDGTHEAERTLEWALPHAPDPPLRLRPRWRTEAAQHAATAVGAVTAGATPNAAPDAPAAAPRPSALSVHRGVRGTGDRAGVLVVHLSSHANASLCVDVRDVLPPWMHVHWHSTHLAPESAHVASRVRFRPATARQPAQALTRLLAFGADEASAAGGAEGYGVGVEVGTGHVLEWAVTLPPRGHARLELDFLKPVQHADVTLAAASAALPLGAARVSFAEAAVRGCSPQWADTRAAVGRPRTHGVLYTDALAVPVAVVDASMPFNVMAISSTLLALFVGARGTSPPKRRPSPAHAKPMIALTRSGSPARLDVLAVRTADAPVDPCISCCACRV
jgi:hypothetical protein